MDSNFKINKNPWGREHLSVTCQLIRVDKQETLVEVTLSPQRIVCLGFIGPLIKGAVITVILERSLMAQDLYNLKIIYFGRGVPFSVK